jgi:hypothetical protein
MNRLSALLVSPAAVVLVSSSNVHGSGSYVGVYADSLGTIAYTTIPAYTSATLYVIAKVSGELGGI